MENYYKILEINSGASEEVIKAAYKALIKKYHPDNGTEKDPTGEKMRMINEAYSVLSDQHKRQEYDYKLNRSKEETGEAKNQFAEDDEPTKKEEYNVPDEKPSPIKRGIFSKIISETITGINDAFDRRHAEIENAYIQACKMPDYYLINEFKESRGIERYGYAKVLEERGYLKKNNNGEWIPTDKYKYFH